MPFYVYYCSGCESEFETFHSIKETLNTCELCEGQDELQRIPQITNSFLKRAEKKTKTGTIVNEYIRDTKQDLEIQKQEAINMECET